jgi:uncharacterized DUF497 family protein
MQKFDWDKANSAHIADHGISCDEAEQVLVNRPIDLDYQNRNGEERLLQLGETSAGRIIGHRFCNSRRQTQSDYRLRAAQSYQEAVHPGKGKVI